VIGHLIGCFTCTNQSWNMFVFYQWWRRGCWLQWCRPKLQQYEIWMSTKHSTQAQA
jgi:hypothetical protein